LTEKLAVAMFDSGIGGLTVLRAISERLPDERIVYFGDTARLPYGTKSRETVTRFSREIVGFLMSKNPKMIVVACNTASAYSLRRFARWSISLWWG
jgi:glutamate racemase